MAASNGVRVDVWSEDLCDPDSPARIEDRLVRSGHALNLLVNNAGVGRAGLFAEHSAVEEAQMIMLDVLAMNQLTRLLVPHLVASRNGAILNVASTAALQPVPLLATYAATKAFVLSFSQALRNELADKGVRVTALCPGPTRTDFVEHAGATASKLFAPSQLSTPAEIARAGIDGLMRGRAVVIPGLKNQWLAFFSRFVSRAMLVRVSRKLMAPAP